MLTHVWTIGGFLGAGKTTLLMRLAGTLAARHKGLAIIANDFSEIGVDQRVLREVYPTVYELFDGCVCCQLSADLVQTIERIQSEIKPELILIEPSGIAEPAKITETLRRYGKHLGMLRTLVVVDATRFDELMETLEPLISAQIRAGCILAINKADIAKAGEIDRVRHAAAELNPAAAILEISAMATADIKRVADEMMSFEGPTANASEIRLLAGEQRSPEQWEEVVSFFVEQVVAETIGKGATVIGHVKTFASGSEGLGIYCSSTGPRRPPSINRMHEKGTEAASDGNGETITLHLNAIVYGLNGWELVGSVTQAISTTKKRFGLEAQTH